MMRWPVGVVKLLTLVTLLALALAIGEAKAFAQATANALPNQGGGGSGPATQTCGWYMYKYWDQLWGWLGIQFEGARNYGTDYDQSYYQEMYASVVLNTTYLPSQTLTCRVTSAGTAAGSTSFPDGDSYNINHQNSSCDGHAESEYPNDANHSFWVTEEMWLNSSNAASGASNAGTYWTGVGEAIGYTALATPSGGETAVYPYPSPPVDEIGRWDHTGSNQLWLNTTYFDAALNSEQWKYITAHELGHAIGFGHSSGTYSNSIMMNGGWPGMDLTPRTLEKCGAVKMFPVDIKVGD